MLYYRCFWPIRDGDLYHLPYLKEETECLHPPKWRGRPRALMEQDFASESYRHVVRFWFLQRHAHLLRNKAVLSLTKRHVLANLKFLPPVLLWLTGWGLSWREVADTSAVVEIPPPQNAFSSLLTWISDEPHLHLQIILCHLSLGLHFHNITDLNQLCLYVSNTYGWTHEAVFLG